MIVNLQSLSHCYCFVVDDNTQHITIIRTQIY